MNAACQTASIAKQSEKSFPYSYLFTNEKKNKKKREEKQGTAVFSSTAMS